jgi:hypothetical protein
MEEEQDFMLICNREKITFMLKKTQIIIFLFLGVVFLASAGVFDRIQKFIEKEEFEKAEKLTRKSLEKDTLNPGAKYYLSLLFFEKGYQIFNEDSAIYYIRSAEFDYDHADEETLNDLEESNITRSILEEQHSVISDYAFHLAIDFISIESLETFMSRYPESDKVQCASYKRDSIAFAQARDKNTWEAYQSFFETYPNALQVEQAIEKYDLLIYKDKTSDGSLESYVTFLGQFPQTPYRPEIEKIIFEKSTFENTLDSYFNFIQNYPRSQYALKAGDILYHYVKNDQEKLEKVFSVHSREDSLKIIHQKEIKTVLPIIEDGEMGFMTASGDMQIDLQFADVSKEYNCGNVKWNWLEVKGKNDQPLIVNRNGEIILNNVSGAEQISESAWLLTDQKGLYHASGFLISKMPVTNAHELQNGWFAIESSNKWGVITPTGLEVLPLDYQSIKTEGQFVILEKGEFYGISNIQYLNQTSTLGFRYDDYELIGDTLMQVYLEDDEGLINSKLQEIVVLGPHEIFSKKDFIYTRDSIGYQFILPKNKNAPNKYFKGLNINDSWLAIQPDSSWIIRSNKMDTVFVCDSLISLARDYVAGIKGEESFVMWTNAQTKNLKTDANLNLIAENNLRSRYLDIYYEDQHTVYDQLGNELFSEKCEELTLLTDSLFRIRNRGKSGLINSRGNKILDVTYDAINNEGNLIFTLKNEKIGTYDILGAISIPAEYESRIEKVANFYKVKSQGKFGLIDSLNQYIFKPEYDDILYWNDTSMWVSKNDFWTLQSIDMTVIMDNIQSVEPWFQYENNVIYTFISEDGKGLLSAEKGVLIEAKYNDIVNLGSLKEPVFFAGQVLKTAEFYVVTYFNGQGESIRSQAFRPEEYERIYCDQ